MSSSQSSKEKSIFASSVESGVKKVGDNIADRALNAIVDGVKSKYGEAKVLLGTPFNRYISNASLRYNQVKTLATGPMPRNIIGKDNIYVDIGLSYLDKTVKTDTAESILKISNHVLISGTGGIGKSMLMRYLFLNTANRGEYVPVLLELRKISNQSPDNISIIDLIYSCMEEFDAQLPKEQFEYSLRLGKYLFLMDGFDEVKKSLASETAQAIQVFCSKYPKNPCIITSRPKRDTSPLETFTKVESMPLDKYQAVELVSKIWKEDEKTKEFCRQLEESLYDKHKDFAENPLLLTMMFLTFMRNNSVPNHLAEFYSKAYDALYSAHDNNDKGFYIREFQCEKLDENSFKTILSHFCFHSYFKEDYEFNKNEILAYIENSISKFNCSGIKSEDFLSDLCNVVCIIVEDGDTYKFSHRSFQAYFAACYTSQMLTDEQQKRLFSSCLLGNDVFWSKDDYYNLLSQIEPERFAINALETELRNIQKKLSQSSNPDLLLFELMFSALDIPSKEENYNRTVFVVGSGDSGCKYYNIVDIFRRFIIGLSDVEETDAENEFVQKCIKKLTADITKDFSAFGLPFGDIESSDLLSESEKRKFFDIFIKVKNIQKLRTAIDSWLVNVDKKHKNLRKKNFIDEL